MAGAGFKTFNTGDVLTASDVNTYLMQQTVMVFASAAARSAALGANVSQGMLSYLKDTNVVETYNGSAWVSSDDPNAIQNALVTAKGQIIGASASGVPAVTNVGANGYTLVADSSTSTGLGWNPAAGTLVNPIINGGMDIWQRGTSFSISGNVGYGADRWYYYLVPACTISRQTTSDTTNLPNIQYSQRVQRNSGQTSTGELAISQSIETANSLPFAGKAVTVSFYAKAGANYSSASSQLAVGLYSGTGTDQNFRGTWTGSVTVVSSNITLTTSWQRFVITGTVGATATELAFQAGYSGTGTAGANDWFEITGVQIDFGTYTASTAPTFRRSGGTIQGELAAAQRYYWRINSNADSAYAIFAYGSAQSTTRSYLTLQTPVQMRVKPTAVDGPAVTNFQVLDANSVGATASAISYDANQSTPNLLCILADVASGLTQFRPYVLRGFNTTSAYLGFTAEL